ncbi:MAG TPA: hypothetical protein VJ608_14245 [Albitalea sp.]|nr:hypothetical protein [Albitalea sp.]
MQRTATLTQQPTFAAAARGSRWAAWLRRVWEDLTMDADERFLRGARDLADLESRMRRLERGRAERFGPLHPDL